MRFAARALGLGLLSITALVSAGEALPVRAVEPFTLKDYRGKEVSLKDFESSRLVVLAFLGTECPLAKLYAGRLQALSQEFPVGDVAIIGIKSNVQDSVTEIDAFVRRYGVTFPLLKDVGNVLADRIGAERTPQAFLLDQQRIVRYQGRIDDQYLVGVVRDKPQREDLKLAITQLLAGQPVSVAATEPLGCRIGRAHTPKADSLVTYSNQIARIFQQHCVECHRDGEIAPFTLTSYEEAAGWGEMIAEVVREQRMPPWHADPHFGKFQNDSSLSVDEKQQIADWVSNGCPEGDRSRLPQPRTYTSGWQLPRAPDVEIAMRDKPFKVPADAGPEGVKYQHFWVDPKFTEDRWVTGAEVRPGNRAVVHHVIVYVTNGRGGKERGFLTAYVPGLRLNPLPEGAAKKIPAGSWLVFQVHYTPNGSPQEDLTSVGINFADPAQISHEVRTAQVGTHKFELKPQLDNQTVAAEGGGLPGAVELISLSPHMHLRGKSFQYEALYPDGSKEVLLSVPRYDFNWQTSYRLAELKPMPAGTRVRCTATYDNSPKNLANPDPSATVRWGDQSWDEMMLGYMDIMFPVQASPAAGAGGVRLAARGPLPGLSADHVLKSFDKNGDGKISREEAEPAEILSRGFDKVDVDRDGFASKDEIQQALNKYLGRAN